MASQTIWKKWSIDYKSAEIEESCKEQQTSAGTTGICWPSSRRAWKCQFILEEENIRLSYLVCSYFRGNRVGENSVNRHVLLFYSPMWFYCYYYYNRFSYAFPSMTMSTSFHDFAQVPSASGVYPWIIKTSPIYY
jgi:hypothetical protein